MQARAGDTGSEEHLRHLISHQTGHTCSIGSTSGYPPRNASECYGVLANKWPFYYPDTHPNVEPLFYTTGYAVCLPSVYCGDSSDPYIDAYASAYSNACANAYSIG